MTDRKLIKEHRIRLACYGMLLFFVMCGIFNMSASSGGESARLSGRMMEIPFFRWLAETLPPLADKPGTSIRKYAHIFEYFCLGISSFLFFQELFWRKRSSRFLASACSVLWSFLFACSDEWHQTFVSARAGRISDVAIDSIGFLSGTVLLLIWCSFRRRRPKYRRETMQ